MLNSKIKIHNDINPDGTWSFWLATANSATSADAPSFWNLILRWSFGTYIKHHMFILLILFLLFPQFSFQVFDHPISRAFQNRFSTQYRCYSVSMLAGPNDRSDVEKGGKSKHR